MHTKTIAEKVTAPNVEIVQKKPKSDDNFVSGRLNICPNKDCSASLKENFISKLEKKEVNCPYCDTKVKKEDIKFIDFKFKKET